MRTFVLVLMVVAVTTVSGPDVLAVCDRAGARQKIDEAMLSRDNTGHLAALSREAIALCPEYAPAHNALGTALEQTGDYESAAAEYRLAVDLEPQWYLPYLGLGDVAVAENLMDSAVHFYRMALAVAESVGDSSATSETEAALSKFLNRKEAGYLFKSSPAIRRHLSIGTECVKPKSFVPVGASADFGTSEAGLLVNLNILFEVNSPALLPEGRLQLDVLADALAGAEPGEAYSIEGFASTEGTAEWNRDLSSQRAKVVRQYLLNTLGPSFQGILTSEGKGASEPVFEGGRENRAKSRRVRIIRNW